MTVLFKFSPIEVFSTIKKAGFYASRCSGNYLQNLHKIAKNEFALINSTQELLNSLESSNNLIDKFYIAKCHFLYGNYEKTIEIGEKLKPVLNFDENLFLIAEAWRNIGNFEEAIKTLQNPLLNKRRKTMMYLANLVDNKEKYKIVIDIIQRNFATSFDQQKYLALASVRAKDYENAIAIWSKLAKNGRKIKRAKIYFSRHCALQALRDLYELDSFDELFVISGTLLGIVRDGNFLNFDKDIDTGILNEKTFQNFKSKVRKSGRFFLLPERSDKVLRVRHVNGVSIDIFRHWEKNEQYWHGGVKVNWWNSKFSLTPMVFQGVNILIPNNYKLYLTENYGNWQMPKPDFDSALDTPNAEVCCEEEIIIHKLQKTILKN